MSTVINRVGLTLRLDEAGVGLETQRLLAFARQSIGDAARSIAAGGGKRTVDIVDAHEGVVARPARPMERHQLIEPQAGRIGDGARFLRRKLMVAPAQVENENLVSGAVHAQNLKMVERMRHEAVFAYSSGDALVYREGRAEAPLRPPDACRSERRNATMAG